MSDILESSGVITVKKTFIQFAKFYGFCSSAKNAAGGVSTNYASPILRNIMA